MDKVALRSISRCLQISLPVKSSGRNQKFGDIERLRDKFIVGVEASRVGTNTVDADGNTVSSDATFRASFLTLRTKGSDLEIEDLPLTSISRADNDGHLTAINYKRIDWVNSEINCGDSTAAAASATANEVYLLTVYYEDTNIKRANGNC